MTILTCDCGYEIYIMDETEATAWQCDRCGQWYDFFGVKVTPPSERKQEKTRTSSTGAQGRSCNLRQHRTGKAAALFARRSLLSRYAVLPEKK